MWAYESDHDGYVPSWDYQNSMEGYVYPNDWKHYPKNDMGSLILLAYEEYVQSFSDHISVKNELESPATTCPSFFSTFPKENWGSDWWRYVYQQGGTYAFNYHLSVTLSPSEDTELIPFSQVDRVSERFVYGEGESRQCRIAENYDSGTELPIWWGHNNNSNFVFGDGHVESIHENDMPLVVGWPERPTSPGVDTTYERPW